MHSAHSSYPQESLALGRTVVNIEKNIKTLYAISLIQPLVCFNGDRVGKGLVPMMNVIETIKPPSYSLKRLRQGGSFLFC